MLTEHVRLESSIGIATVPDKHTIISYSLCKKKLREKCVKLGFNYSITKLIIITVMKTPTT